MAGATLVLGAAAFVLGASGIRGAVLYAVGWPLLVLLVVLYGLVQRSSEPGRRRGPQILATFAFFFGWFTLFGPLVFGSEHSGFLAGAVGGGVFAIPMTAFGEFMVRREHRRILARREARARLRDAAS